MSKLLAVFALALIAGMPGISVGGELAPGNGYSVQLANVGGSLYYTVAEDGYRLVATLAAGPEAVPIRFISTLGPEERVILSVPQSVGEPALELEIVRNGSALFVSDSSPGPATETIAEAPRPRE